MKACLEGQRAPNRPKGRPKNKAYPRGSGLRPEIDHLGGWGVPGSALGVDVERDQLQCAVGGEMGDNCEPRHEQAPFHEDPIVREIRVESWQLVPSFRDLVHERE